MDKEYYYKKDGKDNLICEKEYYYLPGGVIKTKSEGWYIQVKDGGHLLHHPTLPAFTFFREDGTKISEGWFENGKRNRKDDLPAVITYHPNGNIKMKRWIKNEIVHREGDLPAEIYYHTNGQLKNEIYIIDDIIQRKGDKPAWIEYSENGKIRMKQYFVNNWIFRLGTTQNFEPKPSIIIYNDQGGILNKFYRCKSRLYSPEKYLKIVYHLRNKILRFKKRKRNELVLSLKKEIPKLYLKNGSDILKYISKFVY